MCLGERARECLSLRCDRRAERVLERERVCVCVSRKYDECV